MSSSPWNAIVQRAVLGTERVTSPAPNTVSAELQVVLDRVDKSDTERALLASAAIVGAYESAGRLPLRVSPSETEPAPTDDQPEAPAGVARFLTTMLAGTNSEVLREWLAALAARGWRVPSALLPPLLDLGQSAAYLRSVILPVAGARGRWLAARNEDWSWAAVQPPTDEASIQAAWETGTIEERAAILTAVRMRDAGFGRTLLESTWQTDPPPQRAMLLARLETALSLDDEPFLEQALDDRRQEVRRIAATLLCRLPSSALVGRMTVRAQAALHWKPRLLLRAPEVVVEPPADLDDALLRDGVERKPPSGMGERGWWLMQIMGGVPPRVWSDAWNVAPDAIIAAALKGDWAQALAEGWAVAAMVHRDAAWAEALLAAGFPSEKPTPLAPSVPVLLGVLTVDRREAFVTKLLRDDPAVDRVVSFVAAADHAWSNDFAHVVLDWLRKRLATAATLGGAAEWQLREVIPRLAQRIPPTLAGTLDNWPTGADAGGFGRALERFMSIFIFRRELAEELDR